jgi:hypothetical protein
MHAAHLAAVAIAEFGAAGVPGMQAQEARWL